MKRLLALVLAMTMCLGLAACGKQETPAPPQENKDPVVETPTKEVNMDEVNAYLAELRDPNKPMYTPDKSKAEKTLRFAWTNNYDPDHAYSVAALAFASYLELASGGKIVAELYPGAQLGAEREMLEMLMMDSLDISIISAPMISNFSDATWGLEMPYIWGTDGAKTLPVMKEVLSSETGDIILNAINESLDLYAICYAYQGFRQIYLNTKLNSWDDVKGLKLRSMEVESNLKLWKALGFNPVALPVNDVYTQLQQGTIDGTECDIVSLSTTGFIEVLKYAYIDSHFNNTPIMCASNGMMDSLTAEQRQWVIDACKYAGDMSYESTIALEDTYRQKALDAGIEIFEWDLTPLIEKAAPVVQEYCDKSETCNEFVTAVREAVKNK